MARGNRDVVMENNITFLKMNSQTINCLGGPRVVLCLPDFTEETKAKINKIINKLNLEEDPPDQNCKKQ